MRIGETKSKAKANAAQALPELVEIVTDKHFKETICQDALSGNAENYGFSTGNPDDGTVSPQDCTTIFEWLNHQTNR